MSSKQELENNNSASAAAAQQEEQQHQQEEQDTNEEEDAFVDLNDPEKFEVVPDDGSPISDDDDDDDENGGEGGDDDADYETINQNEQYGGVDIVDKNPERDDAFVFFESEEKKAKQNDEEGETEEKQQKIITSSASDRIQHQPLHCIAIHPTVSNLVATAGEDENVYILKLPENIPEPTKESFNVNVSSSSATNIAQKKSVVVSAAASASSPDEKEQQQPTEEEEKKKEEQEKNNKPDSWNIFATLKGHSDTITKVAFSPSGQMLATAGMDGKVCLWNSDPARSTTSTSSTGSDGGDINLLLHTLNDLEGTEIESLLWHPSGMMVVAGSTNAQVIMWNAVKGTAAQYFAGHRDSVTCLSWSNDVKKLVTASADGSLALQNPKSGVAEVTVAKGISEENAGISAMIVLPSSVGHSSSSSVGSSSSASSSSTSSGDALVLVGCYDGTLSLVSLQAPKGRVVKTLPVLHDQTIESIAISSSQLAIGTLVATCACDCRLVLWNCPEFSPRSTISVGEGITKVLFVSTLVLAACTDGDVRIWETRTATDGICPPQQRLIGHRKLVLDCDISAAASSSSNNSNDNNKIILTTCADDGSARAYSVSGSK